MKIKTMQDLVDALDCVTARLGPPVDEDQQETFLLVSGIIEALQGKTLVPEEPDDGLIDFMQSEFESCKRMMMNNGQSIYMAYKAMLQASQEKDNET